MVQHLKEALRREILKKRDSLRKQDAEEMSGLITDKLFQLERFREAKRVAFYMTKGSEVDTSVMIQKAMAMKKEVFVPVTDHKITFYRFTSFADMKPGKYGILEPMTRDTGHGTLGTGHGTPDTKPTEPDVVVVPGVVFGLCMHRIGYGKGYYDKYLAASAAYRVGICYDFQVVERLPTHENDERMDEIVTDKRLISL